MGFFITHDDQSLAVHPYILGPNGYSTESAVTPTSIPFTDMDGDNLVLFWDITAGSAFTLFLTVEMYNPATNTWARFWDSVGVTVVSRRTYIIGREVVASGSVTAVLKQCMPPYWRVVVTGHTTNVVTYSVSGFSY